MYNIEDFENVMKAFVTVEPYAGHWFENEYGACHNFDWEDNWVVLYSDYKDLLEEFKHSENSATEGWIFFEMINSFLVENDLLEITHKGGAKEAALNVIESIKNLNEKYKELLWMREKLEK